MRDTLRAARDKPPAAREAARRLLRDELVLHASVARSDVGRVEWLLRRGRKQLDVFKHADGVSVWTPPTVPGHAP